MEKFYDLRKEQNANREPYKIHSKDENGNYKTEYEKERMILKQKYS